MLGWGLGIAPQKYLGLLDESKKETRYAIDEIEDLYNFAGQLRAAATRYVESQNGASAEARESGLQEAAGA